MLRIKLSFLPSESPDVVKRELFTRFDAVDQPVVELNTVDDAATIEVEEGTEVEWWTRVTDDANNTTDSEHRTFTAADTLPPLADALVGEEVLSEF